MYRLLIDFLRVTSINAFNVARFDLYIHAFSCDIYTNAIFTVEKKL